VCSILDGMARKKPGPKGVLKNPRPAEEWVPDEAGRDVFLGTTEEVGPGEVADSADRLRSFFSERRGQIVALPGEAPRDAVWRIARLVDEALRDPGAVWWSGYEREHVVENPGAFEPPRRRRKGLPTSKLERPWNPPALRKLSVPWGRGGARRHVGPTPPPKAEHKCLWLDTSGVPARLRRYDGRSLTWDKGLEVDQSIAADPIDAGTFVADMTRPLRWLRHTSWPAVLTSTSPLRDSVARMLRGEMGRAGRSGRPTYLAYATLGVLLDRTPDQIADYLAYYRRSLRRRPRA